MFRYFLLFLNFVAFHGFCHTESDLVTHKMNLTSQAFGAVSYEMSKRDAIKAFLNKPLHIIVGQHEFADLQCSAISQHTRIQEVTHDCIDDFYIIKVEKVTAEMSTKWRCIIEELRESTQFTLILYVHVIAAEFPTNLTIGGDKLSLTAANKLSTQYDAIAHYSYKDRQNIQVECQSPSRTVSFNYRDVKETIDIPASSGIARFEKVLSIENNGAELDCVTSTAYTEYTYRIKLHLNETESSAGLTGESTLITISLAVLVIVALLITGVFLIWRQRTNKELQSDSDYVDLVSDSVATTEKNTKTTDMLHELHNNDLYAISMKKLATRENMYEDPVYSVPEQFYQNT